MDQARKAWSKSIWITIPTQDSSQTRGDLVETNLWWVLLLRNWMFGRGMKERNRQSVASKRRGGFSPLWTAGEDHTDLGSKLVKLDWGQQFGEEISNVVSGVHTFDFSVKR